LLVTATHAQEYPNRPVRLVVASAPGGGTEAIARIVGAKLGESLGQQFVVDMRPGAAGIIGTETVARATPDGHTLLMGFIASLVLTPALVKAPYHPIRDFTPVSLIASAQYMLTINPSVPARTLKEFVAYAKANPGRINYSSGGVGTPVHLSAELFKSMAGVNLVHIPYKGGGPAAAAVLSGEAQVIFGSVTATLPQIKAGKLIALGTTGLKRSAAAPEYATIAEQGYPGFEVTSWYGIVGPARIHCASLLCATRWPVRAWILLAAPPPNLQHTSNAKLPSGRALSVKRASSRNEAGSVHGRAAVERPTDNRRATRFLCGGS
jgi:tripartite-type tricarboxylate transporter receptor subunit TctC